MAHDPSTTRVTVVVIVEIGGRGRGRGSGLLEKLLGGEAHLPFMLDLALAIVDNTLHILSRRSNQVHNIATFKLLTLQLG